MSIFDKIIPNEVTRGFDKLGDMFMPKELAPFASILAPMLVGPMGTHPGFGMLLSGGLGQLASAKMHGGKLDPYNALGVFAAGQTPEAKAMRMRGRIDPSQGNYGQQLSAGIASRFGDTAMGQTNTGQLFTRALDPTRSIAMNDYKNYLESDAMAKAAGPLSGTDIGLGNEYVPKEPSFDEAMKADYESYYGKEATMDTLTEKEQKKYETLSDYDVEKGTDRAGDYLETLPRRTVDLEGNITLGGEQGFFDAATEAGAENFLPGFNDSFDYMTGKGTGFNFKKALTTVSSATTIGTLNSIAEELKKQEEMTRAEDSKIWREWFASYKRSTGRDYDQSPYPQPALMEKYRQYMAMGGRVGYNQGGDTGIIAAAPGMPEGMQLDGRDGLFISQGVEEKADDVPAMLSKNEFVLTADAMKGFDKMSGGSGDPRAAAQKMYQFMDQMEAIA